MVKIMLVSFAFFTGLTSCKKLRNINVDPQQGAASDSKLESSDSDEVLLLDEAGKPLSLLHLRSAIGSQAKDPCSPELALSTRVGELNCQVPHLGFLPLFLNQVQRHCQGLSQELAPTEAIIFAACRSAKVGGVLEGFSLSVK